MTSYYWNSNISSFGSNRPLDPILISDNLGGFCENLGKNGSSSISQSLVLNSEKGELVKAPVRVGKRIAVPDSKVVAALKSHSEAERRRRERINLHLSTLRGLVPCKEKMDKATLLAEVIHEVRQLKNNANNASKDLLVPMDADEVKVEPHCEGITGNGTFSVMATICCDYRPGLLSDLRRALIALDLNILKAEVSTLGGRVKNVFILSSCRKKRTIQNDDDDAEAHQSLASSVHEALSSILDKVYDSVVYSPRTMLPNKRRKVSLFDSSSSSSGVVL